MSKRKPTPPKAITIVRVVVLDRDGGELASTRGIEDATSLARGLADAVCIVGLDEQSEPILLARCPRGDSTAGELACERAVRGCERDVRGAA